MGNEKKRTSQVEIMGIFMGQGPEGVRALLGRFPGAKQTFLKVIESLKAANKDASGLEDLSLELYGPPREYVTDYDHKELGDATEIAKMLGCEQNDVYIVARKRSIRAELYQRKPGGTGKGTALYNREEFRASYEGYEAEQKAKYRSDYDTAVHVTSDDIVNMFEESWELSNIHVSIFLKLLGIKAQPGKYRPKDSKHGKNLYDRDRVEIAIAGLMKVREDAQ